MGWSSATLDEANATYNFAFQHTNGKVLTFTVTGAAYLDNPAEYDAAFADAAEVLDASSAFTFLGGGRMTPSNQTYSL
jgi:hypothetical protein